MFQKPFVIHRKDPFLLLPALVALSLGYMALIGGVAKELEGGERDMGLRAGISVLKHGKRRLAITYS
jgi:hypothetical protein